MDRKARNWPFPEYVHSTLLNRTDWLCGKSRAFFSTSEKFYYILSRNTSNIDRTFLSFPHNERKFLRCNPLQNLFTVLYLRKYQIFFLLSLPELYPPTYVFVGDRGSTVVKVLCYKSVGRWFGPSWFHWIFHWYKILPIALWRFTRSISVE